MSTSKHGTLLIRNSRPILFYFVPRGDSFFDFAVRPDTWGSVRRFLYTPHYIEQLIVKHVIISILHFNVFDCSSNIMPLQLSMIM
ncbi:predicted protein [Botrytis cinerea T4]|uniref:Uncharacterized protein n=1 Tax=Botryotinia fuckeliana (strain T4) TaxID=999810 RepID=G2YKA5_BOTF4|nr:predicted protein [Botrytis cinerea T4]